MSTIDRQVEAARVLLRRLMEASGYTGLQLDLKLGWGRGTLGRLLRGEHRLTLEHILHILDALGIDEAFFFNTLFERRAKRTQEAVSYERLKGLLERHGLMLTRKIVTSSQPPLDPAEQERRFDEAAERVMAQHASKSLDIPDEE